MKKVLIANRGEIAIRIIRACKEMGIRTVAVHSTIDRDSLHAKLADESLCIGPTSSAESYLNIPALIAAAELTGADAIHPGYGFLSESHEFARICQECKIQFIGPSPQHIQRLGDKVEARKLAKESRVPLLPGSVKPIEDHEEACTLAQEIGFPVIIKAAAGGGGRGMKVVWNKQELLRQVEIASREAEVAFGSSVCYLEKYLENPRHIEVQVACDTHGNAYALGERDCTIQRRHQKLLEEAPSPILEESVRKAIQESALHLVKSAGYSSLGTVEFLYENGEFYFMEVNTRIQVEHPVTEIITGVDLVKLQIRIAQGEEIATLPLQNHGHAIECRINAEDPWKGTPWPGVVTDYHEPGGPGVRVDSMLYSGYRIPSSYDSLIAKVITYGDTREEALARMKRSLSELRVEGIRTNIPFHLKLIQDPNFIDSNISTRFIERFI